MQQRCLDTARFELALVYLPALQGAYPAKLYHGFGAVNAGREASC